MNKQIFFIFIFFIPFLAMATDDSLNRAVLRGDLQSVRDLLKKGANVNGVVKEGPRWTPLLNACNKGFTEIAELLIEKGADVNIAAAVTPPWTALTYAVKQGNGRVVEKLIQMHARIESWDLVSAVEKDNINILQSLLTLSAGVDKGPALDVALSKGQNEIAAKLIKLMQAREQDALLEVLVRNDRRDQVVTLFAGSSGSDMATKSKVLLLAALHNKKEILDIAIARGADINAKDKDMNTAVVLAAKSGHDAIVETLITNGADPQGAREAANKAYHSSTLQLLGRLSKLNIAVKPACVEVQKSNQPAATLPQQVAQVIQKVAPTIKTVICHHSSGGEFELKEGQIWGRYGSDEVKQLLDSKSPIANMVSREHLVTEIEGDHFVLNVKSLYGIKTISPSGREELIPQNGKVIVTNKIQVVLGDNRFTCSEHREDFLPPVKKTAEEIFYFYANAIGKGKDEVAKLINSGLDVNVINFFGSTPLDEACKLKSKEIVDLFIARGADMNHRDIFGFTALISSIHYGTTEISNLLIEKGADINIKDGQGVSAVVHAAVAGQIEVVQKLIAKGAKISDLDQIDNENVRKVKASISAQVPKDKLPKVVIAPQLAKVIAVNDANAQVKVTTKPIQLLAPVKFKFPSTVDLHATKAFEYAPAEKKLSDLKVESKPVKPESKTKIEFHPVVVDKGLANQGRAKQELQKMVQKVEQKIASIKSDEMFQQYYVGAKLSAIERSHMQLQNQDWETGNMVYALPMPMDATVTIDREGVALLAQFNSRYPAFLERLGIFDNMSSYNLKAILNGYGFTIIQDGSDEITCVKGEFTYIFSIEEDHLINLIVVMND